MLRVFTQIRAYGAEGFRLLRRDAIESRIRRGEPAQYLFLAPSRMVLVISFSA